MYPVSSRLSAKPPVCHYEATVFSGGTKLVDHLVWTLVY